MTEYPSDVTVLGWETCVGALPHAAPSLIRHRHNVDHSRTGSRSDLGPSVPDRMPALRWCDSEDHRGMQHIDGRALRAGVSRAAVRIVLLANDVTCVQLFSARQAFHDGAIRKIRPFGLTSDIWLTAVVRLGITETQRDQTVATTARARSQSFPIVPPDRDLLGTVAYRETPTLRQES